jgi:LacI family transcriptional regulator
VSISTVSKSLRNSPEFEDTRLKVQAFAKFYNYRPNNIVKFKEQKDKSHRNNYTGDCSSFFSTVINGIEQVANENGYSVIICLSDDSLIRKFLTWKCLLMGIDGFIMSLSKETQFKGDFHHISVIDQGMPVVMFDRVTNEIL